MAQASWFFLPVVQFTPGGHFYFLITSGGKVRYDSAPVIPNVSGLVKKV